MLRAAVLLALLALPALRSRARAEGPRPAVLLTRPGDERGAQLASLLEKNLGGKVALRRVSLGAGSDDPIARGRLLASLAASPLVVAVGDESAEMALSELEDVSVYFIAAQVSGRALRNDHAAGMLTYSARDVLAAAPDPWRQGLGVLYTPGYEPVVDAIRAAAAAAGSRLVARKVTGAKTLAPEARALLQTAKAVWPLGDPLLSEGAGFEFLAEQALAEGVPVIGTERSQVGRGAVLCSAAKTGPLARRAADSIAGLVLEKRPAGIELAPEGGDVHFHPGLAKRYGVAPRPDWLPR